MNGDQHSYLARIAEKDEYLLSLDRLFPEPPLMIVEGKGAVLKDIKGKEYIDLFGGFGVNTVGYRHPQIVKAVQKQLAKIPYLSTLIFSELLGELAEKLAKITPNHIKRSYFCNSGSEAVDHALLLARKYSARHEILSLWGGYHGRTMFALTVTGIAKSWKFKTKQQPFVPGVIHIPHFYCYRCPYNQEYPGCDLLCAKIVEDVLAYQTADDVAAFIAEPIQGVAGIIPAPDNYFKEVKRILDCYDILLVMDEVGTAFGRTGKMFASEHYGVEPDILIGGKALTGCMSPLNAIMTTEAIHEVIPPEERFYSTFGGGNLISCAAAIATLNVIEKEQLLDKALRLGEYFIKALSEIKDKHEIVGDVRGKGLMIGVELVKDRRTKEPLSFETCYEITLKAKAQGVILPAGFGLMHNEMRLYPPATITEEQIDEVIQVIDDCLKLVKTQ